MNAATLAYPLCSSGNTHGCSVTTSGIEHYNKDNYLNIYPNPSSGSMHIVSEQVVDKIEVFDVLGRNVFSSIPHSEKSEIHLNSLGAYFVELTIASQIVTKKVIVVD